MASKLKTDSFVDKKRRNRKVESKRWKPAIYACPSAQLLSILKVQWSYLVETRFCGDYKGQAAHVHPGPIERS